MAFPIILLSTSPIPIGLTPGHSSRATSLHVVKTVRPEVSTYWLLMRLASMATASHRSIHFVPFWKEDKRHFHSATSIPEGPATPSVFRITERIMGPSIVSYTTGWGACAHVSCVRCHAHSSLLSAVLLIGTRSSRLSLPPLPCLVRRCMAGLILP